MVIVGKSLCTHREYQSTKGLASSVTYNRRNINDIQRHNGHPIARP